MGRKKPGKPRRSRQAGTYTLQQLQPPGEPYSEWFTIAPGMDPNQIDDPGLGAEAIDFIHRTARIAHLYNRRIPKAALLLDYLLDTGHLPIFGHDDEGTLVPLEAMAAQAHDDLSSENIRESIHNLHAVGALLVMTSDEHDMPYVRMVAKRPERPGDPWYFEGDPNVVTSQVCLPGHMWEELPADVAAAVGFIRTFRAKLEEPDPAVFGTHKGVNGTEHAKELFAAALASGYVDYKGCEACPAGHLCTRKD